MRFKPPLNLWLVHIFTNAAILAMAWGWLSIPDERITDLILSALFGLLVVAITLWIHASTMAFFVAHHATADWKLWRTLRNSVRRIPVFAVWGLFFVAAVWLVFRLSNYERLVSIRTASALTFRLRRPVTPDSVAQIYSMIVWLLGCGVPLMLLLPYGMQIASSGWQGFGIKGLKRTWRIMKRRRYWLQFIVLFTVGVVVPYELATWVPKYIGVYPETLSMAIRLLAAYLLAVTSWLIWLSTLGLWSNSEAES